MQFFQLAGYLAKLEAESSRNEITKLLAEVFSRASRGEIEGISYLLLGELLPAYRGVEFNIAEKLMAQALAAAYGRPAAEIGKRYRATGDLGDVAYEYAARKATRSALSAGGAYERLLSIAKESGEGSQERKVRSLAALIASFDPLSAKFITRIPLGKLRLGFSEATMLDAFSVATVGDKSSRKEIERAYNVTADIGAIAKRLKEGGLGALKRIGARPGIPIRSSLAERVRTAEEAVRKAGPKVAVEPKLDGVRVQIHLWREGGVRRIALFSRNLENTTAMFPEIVRAARRLGVESAILDGEAIGYHPATGTFVPFQETARRKRKHGIEEFSKKIPLSAFVFDLLYVEGTSLLGRPFSERRALLERFLGGGVVGDAIRIADERITGDPAVLERELRENVSKGLEGVVVKNLAAPYQAGSRGFHWIKFKAATAALSHLRAGGGERGTRVLDTVDCVVMGAWRGRGKRAAFGVGGFLLGVRGKDDRYYSLSRLGTGLSDAQFREARERIKALAAKESPKEYVVDAEVKPDVWIRPSLVAEVLADEITRSPRHTAGRPLDWFGAARHKSARGRGYSLRFPRLVRFRDDKDPEDATTVKEIEEMYKKQKA